jgi:hypothetical protein
LLKTWSVWIIVLKEVLLFLAQLKLAQQSLLHLGKQEPDAHYRP